MSNQLAGQVNFYSVNVDENPDVAQRFGVMSIPTMVLMKNGQEVNRVVGAMPQDKVVAFATK